MLKTKVKKQSYIYAAGKRKSASARVRLYIGKGENTVNGRKMSDYFPGPILEDIWSKAFRVVDMSNKFFVTIKVRGGGKTGQVEAVAQGIARALAKQKEDFKKPLKNALLLKRDSRVRERRKVGTGGKARRKKQSPKR